MNILSLFDGMSCGMLALERAGIKVGRYYASEIDKYAQIVSNANYPNIIRVGDVTKWREWGINWFEIDIVIAGSPCQGFSFAGKQLAFDDPRSKLFFEFVDILKFVRLFNPNVKFLLENVKMKKDHLNTISEYMEVEPICINSALVSAQNRVRYYWTDIAKIEQPLDKGILLKDILIDGSNHIGGMRGRFIVDGKRQDHKMKVAGLTTQRIEERTDNKSNCLTTVTKDNLVLRPAQLKEYSNNSLCKHVANALDINAHDSTKRVYSRDGKAPCLVTMQGGNQQPKVLCNVNPSGKGMNGNVYNMDNDKSQTLTTNKGEGLKYGLLTNETENKGKSYTLTASYNGAVAWNSVERKQKTMVPVCESSKIDPNVYNGVYYRKLTPLECERLQTVPDNYTAHVSKSQRYKMLGNGWTVDVIAHIFSYLK